MAEVKFSQLPLAGSLVGDETLVALKPSGSQSDEENVLINVEDLTQYILNQDSSIGGGGSIGGSTGATDNRVLRADGTGGATIQSSGVTIDDSANVSGVAALSATTIELGHASDTTLSRASAGNVQVEGNLLYRAGGTDVPVADGGTGVSSLTAYAVVCGGTTSTGAVQSIASVGTSGQVLTSNGAGALPTFQNAPSIGKQAIWVAAGSITPSASGGCASLATIASAANQPDIQTLDFDATTQEYAQFSIRMPKSWNEGTVTFSAVWSHAATITNFGVVWDLQAVAVSDDDAIAVAFGTAQTSTDTGGTTNDIYASPESSAITVSGTPAAEDVVFFRLSRVTGNGSDTMAVDARLHGITVYITTDAANDA